MKHARTFANYLILTKRFKLQPEKKPVSNLKSIVSVGLSKHLRNLSRFSFRKRNFFTGKKA